MNKWNVGDGSKQESIMRARNAVAVFLTIMLTLCEGRHVEAQILFGNRVDYAAPEGARTIDIADLNSDGLDDIVVGTWNFASVFLSLGPTMGPHIDYPAFSAAMGVATADLDGDGFIDVVSANSSENRLHVFYGTGSGILASAGQLPVGGYPTGVCVCDFNNDGLGDIVSANENSNSVSVLLGQQFRMFRPRVDYPVVSSPLTVATGDLDGNGWTDLLVVTPQSDVVSIFRSRRGGEAFFPRMDVSTGSGPLSLCVADCDGDSILDCAVGTAAGVEIYRGAGDGSLAYLVTIGGASNVTSLKVIDLDLDGHLDVVAANSGTNSIFVLEGLGSGSFGPKRDYSAGDGAWGLGIGDTNGDGLPDLAVANHWANTVTLWQGLPNISAAPVPPIGPEHWLRVGPSPFVHSTRITFYINEATIVRLTVHDVLGRKIAVLFEGLSEPGSFGYDWDGRIEEGKVAAPGLYLVRLWTPERLLTSKVVVSR